MNEDEVWSDPKTTTHSFCLNLPAHVLATLEKHRFSKVKDREKPEPRAKIITEALLAWFTLNGIPLLPEGTPVVTRKHKTKAAPVQTETGPEAAPSGGSLPAAASTPDEKPKPKGDPKWVRDYIKKAHRGEK